MGNFRYNKEILNTRLRPRGITLLENYLGPTVKHGFECDNGHKWFASPNNVLHKTGCPRCNGGTAYSEDQLSDIKKSMELRGITFSEYKNSSTPVEFSCQFHHKWKTKFQSVKDGTGCPYCSTRPPLTKDDINKKLYERNIKLVGDYKSCHTKTMFVCNEGHNWLSIPDNIFRKEQGCPHCYLDFTKPAFIYVLEISDENEKFTGFGISNSKKSRIFKHSSELSKNNKHISRKQIFDIPTRITALDIENRLKKYLPIYNSCITGFKTEATKLNFETVIKIVETYIKEKGHNG